MHFCMNEFKMEILLIISLNNLIALIIIPQNGFPWPMLSPTSFTWGIVICQAKRTPLPLKERALREILWRWNFPPRLKVLTVDLGIFSQFVSCGHVFGGGTPREAPSTHQWWSFSQAIHSPKSLKSLKKSIFLIPSREI